MKNKLSTYWRNRCIEETQKQFDVSYEELNEQLRKVYKYSSNKIKREIEDLYFKLLEDDLRATDIWTYKHYRDLEKSLTTQIVALGDKEIKIYNKGLEKALKDVYKGTSVPNNREFGIINDYAVRQMLYTTWSKKHYSSAIWDNKELMLSRLKKGITESVVLGKSKDKAIIDIMTECNKSFSDSDRLVRTELMHTLNQGKSQKYKDSGLKLIEFVCVEDERLCSSCMEHDGEYVELEGADLPPWHPRCRCTFVPVVDWG